VLKVGKSSKVSKVALRHTKSGFKIQSWCNFTLGIENLRHSENEKCLIDSENSFNFPNQLRLIKSESFLLLVASPLPQLFPPAVRAGRLGRFESLKLT
jgi:hypothetical protein